VQPPIGFPGQMQQAKDNFGQLNSFPPTPLPPGSQPQTPWHSPAVTKANHAPMGSVQQLQLQAPLGTGLAGISQGCAFPFSPMGQQPMGTSAGTASNGSAQNWGWASQNIQPHSMWPASPHSHAFQQQQQLAVNQQFISSNQSTNTMAASEPAVQRQTPSQPISSFAHAPTIGNSTAKPLPTGATPQTWTHAATSAPNRSQPITAPSANTSARNDPYAALCNAQLYHGPSVFDRPVEPVRPVYKYAF
jgi:hypothetical protein